MQFSWTLFMTIFKRRNYVKCNGNFSLQNFCIKHFPLPLPSQKNSGFVIGKESSFFIEKRASASVAQLARAADL